MANDTKQTNPLLDENGKFAKGNKPPAGFNVNPQNRSDGGWKKEDSIGYQYRYLQRLTVDDFKKWLDEHPESVRTMAQELAYQALLKARKELPYLKEITDRTEGKAQQPIDHTTNGKDLPTPILRLENVRRDDSDPQGQEPNQED